MTSHVPRDERVGTQLLFANDVVRVWEMRLAPGEASAVHRHRCDYVIAYASGLDAEILMDEIEITASFGAGHVAYYAVGQEGSQLQRLTNVGDDEHLHFVIELVSRNEAAPQSDNVGR